MDGPDELARDLASLRVPLAGALRVTDNEWEPYELIDVRGLVEPGVALFLVDLQAAGRRPSTLRSYGMALLRWYRFLWAVDVAWDRASRIEARDFSRWMQIADKPSRVHWRNRGTDAVDTTIARLAGQRGSAGVPNQVTGKPKLGAKYAASVRAHSETVLRTFYDFHRDVGSGPVLNPFPLVRERRDHRAHAHQSSMEPRRNERSGLYRPRVPKRLPRSVPDEYFDRLFAALPSDRDRALVAFWVSTGARASELLGTCRGDADPGQQVISVVRKGSRAVQLLPASSDAFVWLRLYQQQLHGKVPAGRSQPLWWTLRRPLRPLTYPAAHRMFERANAGLGSNWTLHDLRHTAAYRMARDPEVPLTDVQWVLGHAHLTTTQIYLAPHQDEVIGSMLAHHARQAGRRAQVPVAPVASGYRPDDLDVLFGKPM
ncbi:site-specific recombinase XerD [Kribbella aluminosa]|uniref:Site-specific recombinase XerD n=2 Tax=Kribbella aluminosa TaxID=416017 RepID=A0ABS4UNP7_9ACTN|nr:site-specific integrase [Kribbella aluminosa]MBP2353255.1 site-specific recombinase XerD [Kribbella aluminosa]MBP2353281.1 site-specific recombinase XerD [Kribbella aluminosa]